MLCKHFLVAIQTLVGHGLLNVGIHDHTELRCVCVCVCVCFVIHIHTYICKIHIVRSTYIRAYIHYIYKVWQ